MNDEIVNNEIRRFLKKMGIQSQQAMEKAIRDAVSSGTLRGDENLSVVMRLNIDALNLELQVDGDIALEKPD